jgi:hypothetical protein
MFKLSTLAFVLGAALPAVALSASVARADSCYMCGGGSSDVCKNYCRYSGQDTFAARKECEKKGCKIGGTSSCPTAVNYKVCQAPTSTPRYGALFAAIPWCAGSPPG